MILMKSFSSNINSTIIMSSVDGLYSCCTRYAYHIITSYVVM